MFIIKNKLILKYKETILYGIFGVLTTAINIISYYCLTNFIRIDFLISNALAWIMAFIFAYYTNSKYVFGYEAFGTKGSLQRFGKFFNSRIFTGVLDMLLMWFFVEIVLLNDSASKIIVNVLVIILNYVMSKFLIFKGEEV